MATYTIGRSDDNSIVLSDTTVSRQHAELETRKRGAYVLRDLDSTYGTRIFRDGDWLGVIEVEVTDDTEVTFGEYRTTIGEIVGMAAAEAAPATERPEPTPAEPKAEPKAQPAAAAAEPVPAKRASGTPASAGSASGSGVDKQTIMYLAIGGGVLILAVVIGLVLALLNGGSDTVSTRAGLTPSRTSPPGDTPRTPDGPKQPAAPATGDRAEFAAALIKSCTRQGRLNDSQCRCIAKQMSEALTREELAIFVALRKVRNDQDRIREIVERFGAQKVAAIGRKMTGMVDKVRRQCGVSLRR